MNEKKIAIKFLIGTMLLSYLTWGTIIVFNQFGRLVYGTPISMALFIIGGLSPTIVACVVLFRSKSVSVKQFFKDIFTFKQHPVVYFMIAVLLILLYTFPVLTGNVVIIDAWYVAILMIPAMMFGGGLEEVGWRYLLQPRLEKYFSFEVTAALTGVIWAFWHLPLFYIAGTNQNLCMNFPMFAIDVFGYAFAAALLRKMGKGVWPCILFHSCINASACSFAIQQSWLSSILKMIVFVTVAIIGNRLICRNAKNNMEIDL